MKNNIKIFLRNFVILLLPLFYIIDLFKRKILNKFEVIVLTFHEVSDDDLPKFEKIIKFLFNRFIFITPEDFENYLEGNYTLKDTSILITFDDGFKSSKIATEKILNSLNIKAVFFICSKFINLSEEDSKEFVSINLYNGSRKIIDIYDSEISMCSQDLIDLNEVGHKIASHTRIHKNLGNKISKEEYEDELLGSKNDLEKIINSNINWFAYPFGGIDYICKESLLKIKEVYKINFTGIRGKVSPNTNKHIIPRQCVTLQDRFLLQLALFYGGSEFMHREKLIKINEYLK